MPVERAQQARAVRRRQVHQHVQQHADDRDRDEHRERGVADRAGSWSARSPIVAALPAHDEPRGRPGRARRCRAARASGRDASRRYFTVPPARVDDVDVRDIRGEDERRRRAAAGARRAACARASAPNSVWVRLSTDVWLAWLVAGTLVLRLIYQHAKSARRSLAACSCWRSRRRRPPRGASRRTAHHAARDRSAAAGDRSRSSITYRDELVLRVTDPDLWRNVGWEDDPNHFVDFGVPELGPFPFTALPREYGAALEKFGMATLKRIGMLPWREAEEFGNLRRAFEGFKRQSASTSSATPCCSPPSRRTTSRTRTSRFTRTNNYDGQLTGPERHPRALRARSVRAVRVAADDRTRRAGADRRTRATPRSTRCWRATSSCEPLLAADRAAIAGKDTYDDDYFEKFFAGGGRFSSSGSATRSPRRRASSSARGNRPASRR